MRKKLRSFYASDLEWNVLCVIGRGNSSRAIQEFAEYHARKLGAVDSKRKGDKIEFYNSIGQTVQVAEVPQKKRRSKVAPSNS